MTFEILHFSYRKWNSFHEQGCYKINIVFRVWNETENDFIKEKFLEECEEWRKAEIITDLELEKKYSSGLKMINADTGRDLLDGNWEEEREEYVDEKKFIPIEFINTNNIKREDVYIKGYQENWNSMFEYIEKFDVFRFYEYFEINPITEGIIQYIEKLKMMDNKDTYYAEQLFRTLKSLELWWD